MNRPQNDQPDPDEILRGIREREARDVPGSLRVFFGMAAGVGKTYAMLRAANQKRLEGTKVLVGVAETHGRAETLARLEPLEVVPKKKIEYRGTIFEELDLDEILRRRPELVVIDELAHTNVPGSRHVKRYQDVIELLDAGISVYTAVNVQHLESRKDLVEQIAQVKIRETVPDSILERATQLELVDITPSELLKRLREGKVYLGDKAQAAAQNFFKQETLTALRELALRLTAERVDSELQAFGQTNSRREPWRTNERLMVSVSHSPHSDKLIRATRRLAYNLEAPWLALNVDVGARLKHEDQLQLARNLALARELGAEVVTTTEADVAAALRRVATVKNVTQIVVGRPAKRIVGDLFAGGSLLDRLVRDAWQVDVHVIGQDAKSASGDWTFRSLFNFKTGFVSYWNTFWFYAGLAMLSGLLDPYLGYRAVGFIFLLGVLAVGAVGSRGPVFFSAFLSALVWNFFFIPPRLTFAISSAEDIIMCLTYFVVALITGILTFRIRKHEAILRDREERTNTLYEILKDISQSKIEFDYLPKVTDRMNRSLGGSCALVLPSAAGQLDGSARVVGRTALSEKELAVAQWTFSSGRAAGWSTETLNEAEDLNLPLPGASSTEGVFLFRPVLSKEGRRRPLSLDQEVLLHSVCRQVGISIERRREQLRWRESERLEDSEKLHQTLLSSISHELRTPLTAITGLASALNDAQSPDTKEFKQTLASELLQASERLNRVIENLLDMSRLNSGVLTLKHGWQDVADLIGVTLTRLGRNLDGHRLKIDVADDLPLIDIDFRLFEHVLSNLLLNAAQYTPPGGQIAISARADLRRLELRVEDSGRGIPAASQQKVFDKFYRVPGSPAGGTGLGLSIAKSIVELHKGTIEVDTRAGGGARFTIHLPLGAPPPNAPEES